MADIADKADEQPSEPRDRDPWAPPEAGGAQRVGLEKPPSPRDGGQTAGTTEPGGSGHDGFAPGHSAG
ncbi:hypothetical protein ACFU99_24710, partial [Streptomyces sp. NPDC057654]